MVLKEFESIISEDQGGIVFLEAALLIEANWYNMCHHIWVVTVEAAEASRRLQKRDGLSESEARSRLESQLTAKERLAYADVVLDNDGSRKDLLPQTQLALDEQQSN
jgi:dephospho-CoA kinase